MFSDPNMAEWLQGFLLMFVAMGVLVGLSSLMAGTVIRLLGDEDLQAQGDKSTIDTLPRKEKKRTAA